MVSHRTRSNQAAQHRLAHVVRQVRWKFEDPRFPELLGRSSQFRGVVLAPQSDSIFDRVESVKPNVKRL